MNLQKASVAAAAAVLVACCASAVAGRAHVHGQAQLDVAIDGESLVLMLEAPLDGFVGFEHAPRTPAQRQAAEAALATLRDGAALFVPAAEARCTLESQAVDAPVLQGGDAAGGHADLQARWQFRCTAPARLRALEHGLFQAFPRLQRIDAQVVGPQGQRKQALRRPARALELQR